MTQRFDHAAIERVRATARLLMDEHHLPGMSLGVVHDGELFYAEGFGYADIETRRPQDPALRQRIGSITKTMTGLCTMALVEEGRLSLEDRAVDLLPDLTFHGPASDLRLRHLLTHTGGIGEVPMPEDLARFEETLWSDTHGDLRVPESYPNGTTIEVAPGTKWAYANNGFALLGEVLMRTEGLDTVDAVLRKRIFEPLGMTNTDCFDHPHPHLATGYHRAPSEDQRELFTRIGRELPNEEPVDGCNIRGKYLYERAEDIRAAGAVQSTVPDMARYAGALLRRGGGIVRPDTFEAMLTPSWQPDARMTAMGLTFFLTPRFGRPTFGHGGSVTGGWNTRLAILPQDDLALLVHLNVALDRPEEIEWRLLRAALDAPARSLPDVAVDPALLAATPGVYEAPTPGPLTNFRIMTSTGRAQITAEEGELVFRSRRGRWKRGASMLPCDPNDSAFFVLHSDDAEPHHVASLRDANGRVSGIRMVALCARDMVRNEAIAPWA